MLIQVMRMFCCASFIENRVKDQDKTRSYPGTVWHSVEHIPPHSFSSSLLSLNQLNLGHPSLPQLLFFYFFSILYIFLIFFHWLILFNLTIFLQVILNFLMDHLVHNFYLFILPEKEKEKKRHVSLIVGNLLIF